MTDSCNSGSRIVSLLARAAITFSLVRDAAVMIRSSQSHLTKGDFLNTDMASCRKEENVSMAELVLLLFYMLYTITFSTDM